MEPARSQQAESPQRESVEGSPIQIEPSRSPLHSPARSTILSPARSPIVKKSIGSPARSDISSTARYEAPRLVITKLVLENFKSYYGRQEIGPFTTHFTAVVGPNGSGKSNVIDSLLFVFGFRAKKMRHDKLENLIHASDAHPNVQACRVEVHFAEARGDVVIQGTELVVARNVSRATGSSYDVDGRSSSHAAVTRLLRQRGIDLDHKRFLILQGEVESIAMMKPKAENEHDDGLLEYLEDIIGTADYKPQLVTFESEIESLQLEYEAAMERAEHVGRDLANLNEERSAIEAEMHAQNALTKAKARYFAWKSHAQEIAKEEAQAGVDKAREAQAERLEKLSEDQIRLGELQAEISRLSAEAKKVNKKLEEDKSILRRKQVSFVKAQERQRALETRGRKLDRDGQAARKEAEYLRQRLQTIESEKDEAEKRRVTLASSLQTSRQQLSELQERVRGKSQVESQKISLIDAKAAPFYQRIREIEAEEVQARRLVEDAKENLRRVQAKFDENFAIRHDISEQGKKLRTGLKELLKKQEHWQQVQQEAEAAIPASEKELNELQNLVRDQKRRLQMARSQRQSTQTRGRVEALLRGTRGFYGRLGDLGSTSANYDCAISTAGGAALNNFVVDSQATAAKCVQMLREARLGRSRFIVLDKLIPRKNTSDIPEGCKRCIDIVKPVDPKFHPAFRFALGGTMVAETLNHAREVVFGRFRRPGVSRVVTTDGMVVSSSGAMTGGGRPIRGLIKTGNAINPESEVSAEDLRNIERSLASAEFSEAEAKQKLANCIQRREEASAELPLVRPEISKLEFTVSELKKQLDVESQRKKDLASDLEKHKTELANVERSLDFERFTHSKEEVERGPLADMIKQKEELQEKVLEMGGLEMREQTSKVRDLEQMLDDLAKRQAQLRTDQVRASTQLSKAEADLVNVEQSLEKMTADKTETETAHNKLAGELAESEQNSEQTAKSKIILDQQLEEKRTDLVTVQGSVDDSRRNELELQNELKHHEKLLAEATARIQKLQYQRDQLILHDLAQACDLNDTETADEVRDELPVVTAEDCESLDDGMLRSEIEHLERQVGHKQINNSVLERYRSRFFEYRERAEVSQQILEKYEQSCEARETLKCRRRSEFMTGFYEISGKLKEMYQLITMGGNAELELVDSLDPFAEGIAFSVMPPRKSWRNVANLSGGEKTLSSLALVFALHHYKPTPLYVMDEIDAALDFRNVSVVAEYIRNRTRNGQFIVISLRHNMFELADRLVGIYKVNNQTKSVALDNEPLTSSPQPETDMQTFSPVSPGLV